MGEKVSIVRCPTYNYPRILSEVRNVLKLLGGMRAYVRKGDKVLLKPNLLSAKHPNRWVTTHPLIVKAVAQLVQEEGGIPSIGDSPAIGSIHRVASQTGMKKVADELGCPLMEFEKVAQIRTRYDYTFRRIELAKAALETDVIINLPKVKTHGMMLLTIGVKNIFGCIPGIRKAQWHLKAGTDHFYFAGMLVELCQIVKPTLTIVDGIVAMEGNGPSNGTPHPLGLILAGGNPLSLDVTISRILGVPPEKLPTTQAAKKRGFEGTDPEHIEVLGKRVEDICIPNFRLPERFDLEWKLPVFIKRPLKKIFIPRPMVEGRRCTGCGTCADLCPPKAISLFGSKVSIDYGRCIRCYCCQEVCPEGAVYFKDGWAGRFTS
jgi:uncharacterized protein (DUF362 family)/Pyruvate/2-oxoacid:ferredoxin oxidoreductase delta subunit